MINSVKEESINKKYYESIYEIAEILIHFLQIFIKKIIILNFNFFLVYILL
jgi:hypothetical protein